MHLQGQTARPEGSHTSHDLPSRDRTIPFSARSSDAASQRHDPKKMTCTHGPSSSRKFAWSLTVLLQVATERSAGSHSSHDPPSRDHTMQCSPAMSRRHDPRPTQWHSHTTRWRTARSHMALSRSTAQSHSTIEESRFTAGERPWSSGAASVLSLAADVLYVTKTSRTEIDYLCKSQTCL